MELLRCVEEVGALKFHVLENTHTRDVQGRAYTAKWVAWV
jgi:hypothetical protein